MEFNAHQFIFAGNAIFTIDNGKGEHFTFRVRKPETPLGEMDAYFVSVLTGPDNTRNYTYLGLYDNRTGLLKTTRASKISTEAKSFRVAHWTLWKLFRQEPFPIGYTIHHEGRCGRCGRLLTVPESIKMGIGPECCKIMGIALEEAHA